MPKFLEEKLKAEASKKGFSGKRADRYVYGAMNNMGAMRGNKETAKGERMDAKHRRDEEIGKFRGKSSSFRMARPKRKVQNRYV